ncbi:nucleotidyltransferase domain-containing protein [Oceanobacillus halophilus]|uniref:Nucleotidyltransferase domain-containing protein n=1 Tax=Oceanobacillus halophilus TaxID=930130 RepID=A0A494ZW07_9BACI|nr:nucleotidyltransferase domain-containing protein [Oceanobacillus halophilus]RKQ30772.1 nucleotidyltransferase domain-containing protein [Oceanobacillus halophilus]
MREIIKRNLHSIEETHQVKILYACEAGSRAWGLENKSSDYDVRFIYIHPTNDYLSIDPMGIGKKTDVMEVPISDKLDMFGWECTKALRLFRKSNPSFLEWLHSELVYSEAFTTIKKIKDIENDVFSAKSSIHHYVNMAKNNFKKYQQADFLDIKQLLNVIRPILLAKWIEENKRFPSVNLPFILENLTLKKDIIDFIYSLIQVKKSGRSTLSNPEIEVLQSFSVKEITRLKNTLNKLGPKPTKPLIEPLDNIFRETLNEVWGE